MFRFPVRNHIDALAADFLCAWLTANLKKHQFFLTVMKKRRRTLVGDRGTVVAAWNDLMDNEQCPSAAVKHQPGKEPGPDESTSTPILVIRNHHSESCGVAPSIDGKVGSVYVGYYENVHGEQWVFSFDRKSGKTTLRGGDVGWDEVLEVVDGHVSGLILTEDERLWLQACWSASHKQTVAASKDGIPTFRQFLEV